MKIAYWLGIISSILITIVAFKLINMGYSFTGGCISAIPYSIMYFIGKSETK